VLLACTNVFAKLSCTFWILVPFFSLEWKTETEFSGLKNPHWLTIVFTHVIFAWQTKIGTWTFFWNIFGIHALAGSIDLLELKLEHFQSLSKNMLWAGRFCSDNTASKETGRLTKRQKAEKGRLTKQTDLLKNRQIGKQTNRWHNLLYGKEKGRWPKTTGNNYSGPDCGYRAVVVRCPSVVHFSVLLYVPRP